MSGAMTTVEIVDKGLRSIGTDNGKAVLSDAEAFAFLVSIFNATLKLASGKPADIVVGLSMKALSTGKVAAKAARSEELIIGATAAQIIVTTAALVTIAGKGPTYALVAVGATFAKKTSLALSLAGSDQKKAKCLAALTDLAASGLTTGLVASTAVTGIGAVVLAGSLAQLFLSGYQTYQACFVSK